MTTDLSLLRVTELLEQIWKCCDKLGIKSTWGLEGPAIREIVEAWGISNIQHVATLANEAEALCSDNGLSSEAYKLRECKKELEQDWAVVDEAEDDWGYKSVHTAVGIIGRCARQLLASIEAEFPHKLSAQRDAVSGQPESVNRGQPNAADSDPLRAIYDRLILLVVGNFEWWRTWVRNWAADPPHHDNRILPIPLPAKPTEGEGVTLLAAIYDSYATVAARIDPWPEPNGLPPLTLEPGEQTPVEYRWALRYQTVLSNRIPLLRQHWESQKPLVEMLIAFAEQELRAGISGQHNASNETTFHKDTPLATDKIGGLLSKLGVAGDHTSLATCKIAISGGPAEKRMRDIYEINPASIAWTSARWAELLDVSDAAIRGYAFWKIDLNRLRADLQGDWKATHPGHVMPSELAE